MKQQPVCKSASMMATNAPRWMIFTAFALLITLAVVLIWRVIVSARKPTTLSALPNTPQTEMFVEDALPPSTHSYKLVFMHMNGCGWCVRFKPIWDDFVSQNTGVFGKCGLTVLDFERTAPGAKEYESHVSGYPTVLFIKESRNKSEESEIIKFEGERTVDGLNAFLEEQGVWKLESDKDGSMKPTCQRPVERFSGVGSEFISEQIEQVKGAVKKYAPNDEDTADMLAASAVGGRKEKAVRASK